MSTPLYKPVLLPATERQGIRVFLCACEGSQLVDFAIYLIFTKVVPRLVDTRSKQPKPPTVVHRRGVCWKTCHSNNYTYTPLQYFQNSTILYYLILLQYKCYCYCTSIIHLQLFCLYKYYKCIQLCNYRDINKSFFPYYWGCGVVSNPRAFSLFN